MTRLDLQEAIGNLEYLILRAFDPAKVKDYDRQLKALRRELRALDDKGLTPTRFQPHMPSGRL